MPFGMADFRVREVFMNRVVAIIVAGGRGLRMGEPVNKILLTVAGQTILETTVSKFQQSSLVDDIILVVNEQDEDIIKDKFYYVDEPTDSDSDELTMKEKFSKVRYIVKGGDTRTQSVYNGLCCIEQMMQDDRTNDLAINDDNGEFVLIHDAARPMVSSEMIDAFITKLFDKRNLVMAVRAIDTIKKVCDGVVVDTPKRSELWHIQTPQGFEKNALVNAYKRAIKEQFQATDDSSIMEWDLHKVHVFEGSRDNVKLTVKDDLDWIKYRLESM